MVLWIRGTTLNKKPRNTDVEQSIPRNDFSSSWNTLTTHLQASQLITFVTNWPMGSCKEKIIVNDDVFVHNICLALTINLLAC